MMRILVFFTLIIFTTTYAQLSDKAKVSLFTYGGLPKVDSTYSTPTILYNTAYITAYDENHCNPLWVAYRLGNSKGSLETEWERPFGFIADDRTISHIEHDSYNGSGYDRGHLAPNATILGQYGQIAQLETFLMTNICPQKPHLNQRIWAELERQEREILSQDDTRGKEVHDLYVITGPIFNDAPAKIDGKVSIPVSFFRIIAFGKGYGGTVKAIALIIPQDAIDHDLTRYLTTVDIIESLAHIDFFPELSQVKQRNLESKKRNFQLDDID